MSLPLDPLDHVLAIGTRLHLGNASEPPTDCYFKDLIHKFVDFASSCNAKHAYIAVDAAQKFPTYSLLDIVETTLADSIHESGSLNLPSFKVIPVTPWNAFVPALNAIASQAAQDRASLCLFCSAETQTSPDSILTLVQHMDDLDTLVAGAVLPGHSYQPNSIQQLSGVTSPWNTLAVWNVQKLTLTGFPLVADGLHVLLSPSSDMETTTTTTTRSIPVAAGVEEVSTIALLQHLLGPSHAKAKLVFLKDSIQWDQNFENDPGRQEWHARKMKSKVERPAVHLQLLKLENGIVEHC